MTATFRASDDPALRSGGELPWLAVLFDRRSIDPFLVGAAAWDTWRTVWLVDQEREPLGNLERLLLRFGPVLDTSDLARRTRPEPLGAVEGLMVLNEGRLVEGADVAARLGVPFLSDEAIVNVTHKDAQRAAFRSAGLPTPETVVIPAGSDPDDAVRASDGFRYPAVVKPVQGRSSRATRELHDSGDLRTFIQELELPTVEDFILEERIPDGWRPEERPWGDYVSVETFRSAGRFSHFSVTGRMPLASRFRETGAVLPSNVSESERDVLLRLAEQAIDSLGAEFGVFHTEIKLSAVGPRVIEVNGRLGGGGLAGLAQRVAGRSLGTDVGRVALGLPVDFSAVRFDGVGFTWFPPPPEEARLITAMEGLDEARGLPGVDDITVRHRVGDEVLPAEQGTLSSPLMITGRVDDHDALWTLIDEIRATITVEFAH